MFHVKPICAIPAGPAGDAQKALSIKCGDWTFHVKHTDFDGFDSLFRASARPC